jgi:hypothetical protein
MFESAFANLSSPQGVRSVGGQLFDNLIFTASAYTSRVSWFIHFHQRDAAFLGEEIRSAKNAFSSPFGFES